MKLSKQSFEKARDFIRNNAAGPDKAIFKYLFENGTKEEVLTQLAAYQNEDGGFGSLEYDFELESSSVMATLKAFQYFDRLNLDSNHAMVQKGIQYFTAQCNQQRFCWQPVPPEVNSVPHAPWWSFKPTKHYCAVEDMVWEDFVDEYNPNTNAEIVAYLLKHQELLPPSFPIKPLKQIALDKLLRVEEIDMHALHCYTKLYDAVGSEDKVAIRDKIVELIQATIERNPEKWKGYGAQPLLFVESPDSLGASSIRDVIELNLDYLITRQGDDGAWSPNWSWGGGQYEDAWQRAQRNWKGYITVENLLKLSAFGRL